MNSHDDMAAARRAAIERTKGMFAHLAQDRSMVDELIAQRRAEARAEDLEDAERRLPTDSDSEQTPANSRTPGEQLRKVDC